MITKRARRLRTAFPPAESEGWGPLRLPPRDNLQLRIEATARVRVENSPYARLVSLKVLVQVTDRCTGLEDYVSMSFLLNLCTS